MTRKRKLSTSDKFFLLWGYLGIAIFGTAAVVDIIWMVDRTYDVARGMKALVVMIGVVAGCYRFLIAKSGTA